MRARVMQFDREWFIRMAKLEGDSEIGAGALDHPLRMRYVPCGHCHGTGEIIYRQGPRHAYDEPNDYAVLCSACDGYGTECVETDDAGIEHTEQQLG